MSKKQKRMLYRIGGAAAFFIPGMILEHSGIGMALLLAAYALIGWDILWRAAVNIRHGRVFDENFLMSIATIGAILLGDYSEGVAVMLLYQIGEWFQAYAVQRSRRSISSLMDIRPDTARVLRGGEEEDIGGNHLDQGRGTGQNGGEDPAGGDDEQADHALKGPGDDEQGVEGHQRRQSQDRPRSPQGGDR